MAAMVPITEREDLLKRIRINRRRQTETVESMLGQFGGTEKMQALLRELSELERKLNILDSQSCK